MTDPMDLCDLLEKPIDYGIVQQRFSDFIDSSKRYLDNCLSYFSGCGGDPIQFSSRSGQCSGCACLNACPLNASK